MYILQKERTFPIIVTIAKSGNMQKVIFQKHLEERPQDLNGQNFPPGHILADLKSSASSSLKAVLM